MAWKLTDGLQNFRRQFNERFPNRDKTSDGTIGDLAHQGGTSGHNPDDTPGSRPEWEDPDDDPEVRAIDLDAGLREPGTTMQDVIDHLVTVPGLNTVIRYMIHNRRIYEWNGSRWVSSTYTGDNPHTEHAHFSGQRAQVADENDSFDYRLDEINMPTADDIINRMADRLENPNDPFTKQMRAVAWQYAGRGLQGAPNTLEAVADTQTINGKVDALLLAVAGIGDVDEGKLGKAVGDALIPPLHAAILEAFDGVDGATPEEVESILVRVLGRVRLSATS